MCGICGFTGPPDRPVLRSMVDTLAHRGPDDAGWLDDPEASLGVRRLSIIDLAAGHQPLANESDEIWTAYNGEVYNFVALRQELEGRGHRFRTRSDTEVLVHLYEDEGTAFPRRLEGMFAAALWDRPRRRLLLARDRVGIKPLYFTCQDGRVIFGSELKAILAHPAVRRKLDLVSLHHYLSLKHVPAPRTIYEGIETVLPGELVLVEGDRISRERYWQFGPATVNARTPAEAAEALRPLLERAVWSHLVSDVPVGAYLSGGLDSSTVVSLMHKAGHRRLRTFSLTYADPPAGKREDAAAAASIAAHFGTEHRVIVLRPERVIADLPAVVEAFDEPFAGVISTYFLTGLIRNHVKVALSGDGADELFGSYRAHRLAIPLAHFAHLRRSGRRTPATWTDADRGVLGPFSDRVEELEALLADGEAEWQWRARLVVHDEAAKAHLYTPEVAVELAGVNTPDLYRRAFAGATGADPLNRVLEVECTTLLPDQVLAFVDRLSMAHSVEVRPPFLDHRVVEFVAALPGAWKIRGGLTKAVLRDAVRPWLPPEILARPKEGFLLPLGAWLRGPLRPFVEAVLSPCRLRRHGLFRPEAVHELLSAHAGGDGDGNRVWTLVMFQLWWERYLGGHG